MFGENPPAGLRWANTTAARSVTTIMAVIALALSAFLLYRLDDYVDCIADQQSRSDERSRALAAATDVERAADTAALAGVGKPDAERLRQAAVAARAVTDQVRRQNPPPPIRRC